MLIKRGNAKTDPGEFFVFEVFLCFEAKHTESNKRALPFGFSESLRLPFLLTLCVCVYLFVLQESCTEPVVRWALGAGLADCSSSWVFSMTLFFLL